MTLKQLQYFVQIVESKTFTKAAAQLYITQPTLTAAINELENELQLTLLIRSNKGVEVTSEGLKIYNDCKELLAFFDQKYHVWLSLSSRRVEQKISVNIMAIPSICNLILDNMIVKLKAELPNIVIEVQEARAKEIFTSLQANAVNIAILSWFERDIDKMYQKAASIGLTCDLLAEDEYAFFLSKESPYAQNGYLQKEDCFHIPLATYSDHFSRSNLFYQSVLPFFDPNKTYYLSSRENIMQLVVENKAIAFFLKKTANNNWYAKNGFVHCRALKDFPKFAANHYVVYNAERLSPLEQQIVALIKSSYPINDEPLDF